MPNSAWRIFIAVELPAEVRERITAHVKHVRELVPEAPASWTRPENIHLTLKFLGDTPQTDVEKISEATSRSVAGFQPFKIDIAESGAFPARSAPRVLWIGISDLEGKLADLHARLEKECSLMGFKREARRFHPHLTVARLRKPQDARKLAAAHNQIPFAPVELIVSEVLVIRSELSAAGSRYTTISRHPLGAE